MDVDGFLREIQTSPAYRDQIVYVHEVPARPAEHAAAASVLSRRAQRMLASLGIERLYSHQADAIRAAGEGRDVLVVTGTASGKSLCYLVPIIEMLAAEPEGRALLLFPTKALCQDQYKAFGRFLAAGGRADVPAGVYDGDTPSATRRPSSRHSF